MKTLTRVEVERLLKRVEAKQRVRHTKNERAQKAWCNRHNRKYTPSEFKSYLPIPWKPRLEIFKYSARSKVEFDPSTMIAYSYGHWEFVWLQKGKLIFNSYSYSHTTCKHQGMVRSLLRVLGLKIDLYCDLGRNGTLDACYRRLYQYEVEQKRANAKSRKALINLELKNIQTGLKIGLTSNVNPKNIKADVQAAETERLEEMRERAAERKALRERIKAIGKADPNSLNVNELQTTENVEVRKALVNRIGLPRVLKELNARVLDTDEEYQLLDLRFQGDPVPDERVWGFEPRIFLKMTNPSTGEIHVEGVEPRCKTVAEALAWRNGLDQFIKPMRLT